MLYRRRSRQELLRTICRAFARASAGDRRQAESSGSAGRGTSTPADEQAINIRSGRGAEQCLGRHRRRRAAQDLPPRRDRHPSGDRDGPLPDRRSRLQPHATFPGRMSSSRRRRRPRRRSRARSSSSTTRVMPGRWLPTRLRARWRITASVRRRSSFRNCLPGRDWQETRPANRGSAHRARARPRTTPRSRPSRSTARRHPRDGSRRPARGGASHCAIMAVDGGADRRARAVRRGAAAREPTIIATLDRLARTRPSGDKTRIHGDYHLGQISSSRTT